MSKIRSVILKAAHPFIPAPWRAPTMEYRYGIWRGISTLFSEDGRQLGEENARPFILNRHIPAETVACKYEGSRYGKQINVTALRTAMRHFSEALDIVGAVRTYHMERVQKTGRHATIDQPGLWDLYILSRACISLIAYEKRQRHQPPTNATVSNAMTGQYQFISGIFMICRNMMESGDPAISENRQITCDDLYTYADNNEIFSSPNGMVCAGSTSKILEFIEFCLVGTQVTKKNKPAPTAIFNLSDMPGGVDNWYRYAMATIDLDCILDLEGLQNKLGDSAALDDVSAAKIKSYRAFGDYCRSLADLPAPQSSALDRQNHILALLGRRSISKIPQHHIVDRVGPSG